MISKQVVDSQYCYKGALCCTLSIFRSDKYPDIIDIKNDFGELMYRGYESMLDMFLDDLVKGTFDGMD
jgi:predicted transcriptional regulator